MKVEHFTMTLAPNSDHPNWYRRLDTGPFSSIYHYQTSSTTIQVVGGDSLYAY